MLNRLLISLLAIYIPAVESCNGRVPVSPTGTCGPQQTMFNEAFCRCCYVDTKGHPTIGIGYNLDQPGADATMRKYGLNVTAVKQDCYEHTTKHCLTQANALDLFNTISYSDKVGCVERFVPGLPPTVKAAVVDMAFGGCGSLQGYPNMKDALMKRDWKRAADESTKSDWCGIVGPTRCQMDHRCIASGM